MFGPQRQDRGAHTSWTLAMFCLAQTTRANQT